jgi:xanthine dehydrogenase accessory factor
MVIQVCWSKIFYFKDEDKSSQLMGFWSKINEWLSDNRPVILLYVIDSQGSSPGRVGFKMAINNKGELTGSIGGGIMEHKLIEMCREDLFKKTFDPFIKNQIHQTNISENKSGMICSGEQTIAFYQLNSSHSELFEKVSSTGKGVLTFDQDGITLQPDFAQKHKFISTLMQEKWVVKEDVGHFPTLHIIGAGHVGLALSRIAHEVGFVIKIYDDRANLNTLEQNKWADYNWVMDYSTISDFIASGHDDYVVIMSFGYQTDKIILNALVDRNFRYLGMMGSKEKVKKLFEEMGNVYSPIGIPISSKTPEEIAVSILAEVIGVKNG